MNELPDFTMIERKFAERSREGAEMLDHMPTLRRYASQSQSVVEFGSNGCNSTWALLAGRPAKMRCYDITRYEPYFTEVERGAAEAKIDFAFVIRSSTDGPIDPCDLLFIDSTHYYEHCSKELALHHANVAKWIIFHDTTEFEFTNENRQGLGLWPAIEEFMAAHPEWQVRERSTSCHGLTVLERRVTHPVVEVCVAHWHEDLGWLKDIRPEVRVMVHETTDAGLDPGVHFSHIVSRYATLADWTFFIQAKPFDHEPRMLRIINEFPRSLSLSTYSPEPGWHGFSPNGPMEVERTCWKLGEGRGAARDAELAKLTVYDRCAQIWGELFLCDPPETMRFEPGFHFVASRDLLHARVPKFYERLLELIVGRELGPWECERLLGSLWLHEYNYKTRW